MPFLPLYLFITGWIILWPYLLCDNVNKMEMKIFQANRSACLIFTRLMIKFIYAADFTKQH